MRLDILVFFFSDLLFSFGRFLVTQLTEAPADLTWSINYSLGGAGNEVDRACDGLTHETDNALT